MSDTPKIVICTNVEHLCEALDLPCEASCDDAYWLIAQWHNALLDELRRAGFDFAGDGIETDRNFSYWNGGKYGSQASMYGYETRNVVAWRGVDDAIIDAALERAEQALVRAELELHESDDITPGEARILDRIARDAGIVGD